MPPKFFCAARALQALARERPYLAPRRLLGRAALADNLRLAHAPPAVDRAARLVERVALGLLPVAQIELRAGKRKRLSEPPFRRCVHALGLGCHVATSAQGVTEAFVFQRSAALGHFYDATHVAALSPLAPEAFETLLSDLVGRLHPAHPLLGFCRGLPVHEALLVIGATPARPPWPC